MMRVAEEDPLQRPGRDNLNAPSIFPSPRNRRTGQKEGLADEGAFEVDRG